MTAFLIENIAPLIDQISGILVQAGIEEVVDRIKPGAALPPEVSPDCWSSGIPSPLASTPQRPRQPLARAGPPGERCTTGCA